MVTPQVDCKINWKNNVFSFCMFLCEAQAWVHTTRQQCQTSCQVRNSNRKKQEGRSFLPAAQLPQEALGSGRQGMPSNLVASEELQGWGLGTSQASSPRHLRNLDFSDVIHQSVLHPRRARPQGLFLRELSNVLKQDKCFRFPRLLRFIFVVLITLGISLAGENFKPRSSGWTMAAQSYRAWPVAQSGPSSCAGSGALQQRCNSHLAQEKNADSWFNQ